MQHNIKTADTNVSLYPQNMQPDDYIFQPDYEDDIFTIFAKNDETGMFEIACTEDTYRRIKTSLAKATKIETHDFDETEEGFSTLTVYDENGESEDINVYKVLLPTSGTVMEGELIGKLLDLINELEREDEEYYKRKG